MGNGLTTEEEKTIAAVFAQVPAIERAVLFGSRAMGLARSNSDVDIALYGEKLSLPDILHTASLLEDTPLPYQFDLISHASITSPDLLEHIRQYGKEMYRKMEKMNVIPFGWTITKLGNLGEVNRGRSRHRPRYAKELYGGPYPFIQTGDIKASNGRINSHTQTYNEKGLAQSRLWPKETMCITIAANIAETGILCYPACFPDSVIGFIANKNKCDVYFIEYMFRFLRRKLKNEATGSVQDNINLQTLERLEFLLPPLAEQKRIAQVLNSLDDKIENNRKINQCLEQMAQAIFKSWFVDFEPWGGVMPNDWREGTLGQFVEIKRGGSPRPIQEYLSDTGYRWLKISDVTSLQTPFVMQIKENIKESGIRKTVFRKAGTLVLSNSATPGIPKILGIDTCIHDGWLYFPKSRFSNEFLYLFFQHIRKDLVALGNGSVFNNLKTDILKAFPVVYPGDETLMQFDDIVVPLFKGMENATRESIALSTLRDTLLPKLLSGEIRIPEAEEMVKEKE